MEKLRDYLNSLTVPEQIDFATRCGTTAGYLRMAISAKKKLGGNFAIAIERESEGRVKCEEIRPDIDWAYIRNSASA